MLSDSCFQCVDDLLNAIRDYDYSDDYRIKLIHIIMDLNEIKDELDHCRLNNDQSQESKLLKDNKVKSARIAMKMFENAQKKREMSSIDFYDDIYNS